MSREKKFNPIAPRLFLWHNGVLNPPVKHGQRPVSAKRDPTLRINRGKGAAPPSRETRPQRSEEA